MYIAFFSFECREQKAKLMSNEKVRVSCFFFPSGPFPSLKVINMRKSKVASEGRRKYIS